MPHLWGTRAVRETYGVSSLPHSRVYTHVSLFFLFTHASKYAVGTRWATRATRPAIRLIVEVTRAHTHIYTHPHIYITRAPHSHTHMHIHHAYTRTSQRIRKWERKNTKKMRRKINRYIDHTFFFLQFIVHRTFELERTSAFPAHAQLPKKKFHDNSRVRATKSAKISRRLKIHGATRLRIIESSAARENVVFRRAPESAGWLTRYTILLLKDSPVEGPQEKEKKLNNENEAGFSPTGTCSEVRRAKRINNRDTFLFLRATGYIFGTYFIYLFIFFFFFTLHLAYLAAVRFDYLKCVARFLQYVRRPFYAFFSSRANY